jgi:hypothetical protein
MVVVHHSGIHRYSCVELKVHHERWAVRPPAASYRSHGRTATTLAATWLRTASPGGSITSCGLAATLCGTGGAAATCSVPTVHHTGCVVHSADVLLQVVPVRC